MMVYSGPVGMVRVAQQAVLAQRQATDCLKRAQEKTDRQEYSEALVEAGAAVKYLREAQTAFMQSVEIWKGLEPGVGNSVIAVLKGNEKKAP